jgi:hypothetical protein
MLFHGGTVASNTADPGKKNEVAGGRRKVINTFQKD